MAQKDTAYGDSRSDTSNVPMPTVPGVVFGTHRTDAETRAQWSITRQQDGHSVIDPWSMNAHPVGNDTWDMSEPAEQGDIDLQEPNEFMKAFPYVPTSFGPEYVED